MAYVSHANGSATVSGTTTSSAALSVTGGNTLVVVFTSQEWGSETFTCADTAGNTYGSPVIQASSGAGDRVAIFVCHNCSGYGANVATVTSSGAHRYKFVDQIQLNPGGTGSTDDSDSHAAFSTAAYVTPNMTATGAGTIVYGCCTTNDRTWTPNTNFTEISDFGQGMSTGYRDITGSGTFTAGATANSASNGSLAAVIVKDAAGGGGTGQPTVRRFGLVEHAALRIYGAEGVRLMREFDRRFGRAA